MKPDEAQHLLASAVTPASATWADLGAGDGTFTLALAHVLGAGSHIYAVDRDARVLRTLEERASKQELNISSVVGDFTTLVDSPGSGTSGLDGLLFANSLHYVSDAAVVLTRLVKWLRPGGRVVFIEYDRRRASLWVPYPIDAAMLLRLCEAAGLSRPSTTARRPSDYGGEIYVAYAERSS